jgi:UDP-galactose-lipid carrier transferase
MSITNLSQIKAPSAAQQLMNRVTSTVLIVVADLCAWYVAYQVAAKYSSVSGVKFAIMAAAWCGWAAFVRNQYNQRHSFWAELGLIVQGASMLAFVGAMLKVLIGNADSLWGWFFSCVILLVLVIILRAFARVLLRKLGWWGKPTIVFGSGENAREAVLALNAEQGMGYSVYAQVALVCQTMCDGAVQVNPVKLGWPKSLADFEKLRLFQCVIALEAHEFELRDALIRQLSFNQIQHVHVIPAMRGVPLFGLESTNFFSHEVLMIHLKNRLSSLHLRVIKRAFDVLSSIALLVLFAPLFAYVAYKISRDGGSVFFGHERVGQNGCKFKCYKFRSMVINAQEILEELLLRDSEAKAEWEKDFKIKNDPRVNLIGGFLRRTSLDELPQLWNVLKGEMSLVGPRPIVLDELNRYGDDVVYYLMAKPGMTGLWQVSGRNDVDYDTRVYLDVWYVKNWSLWTDIAILFKTISVVIGRRGAY